VIEFGEEVCRNLDAALEREWLETNGIGGFASSTIAGANTRRYHGLLIAALRPPIDRYVLLSKLEETVLIDGRRYELGCNLYPGATHPTGYRFLKRFRLDPFPVFTFTVEGLEIEKRVFMLPGENATVVEYQCSGGSCGLELRPLIAFRDYHSTTHENPNLNAVYIQQAGEAVMRPYEDLPQFYLAHNARSISGEGVWYRNFEYPRERERGLEYWEDLFQPFVMAFDLSAGSPARVIASTESHDISQSINPRPPLKDTSFPTHLTAAAEQFVVRRAANLHTVIAGYHWFGDWGRDTMISLPGLTLVAGRFDVARDILLAFCLAVNQGMLPNRFPDKGDTPEYNTVDATLWYFEAIRRYIEYSSDIAFVQEHLYDTLKNILDWHIAGTRFGIHCDADGLLVSGSPGSQLTWMDAKIGDFVATPRHGKPAEIQALWYNAIRFTSSLAARFAETEYARKLDALAEKTLSSFHEQFWNAEAGCLFDVVEGSRKDASIRPNQIIALSLGHPMISDDRARAVLEVVERELLTPFGLRTLNPSNPQYRPHYGGDQFSRDSGYHQGTVWPWLLGPFITAYLKSYDNPEARAKASAWLTPFQKHLTEAGLGTVSEIFDADPPHAPRGCIAQAWSVAELLRVLVEHQL
jgi:predicted glycogen debranching enzyme